MKAGTSSPIVQQIRRIVQSGNFSHSSDGELLRVFVAEKDEDAFAAVIRRHGSMVLAVARRHLDRPGDADDVFQATFLLLVQKARGIAKGESLGSWLHGVSYRLAHRLRQQNQERCKHETKAATMGLTMNTEANQRELREVLDHAIHQLPKRYRAVFILCYLEGKTHEEAAKQLGHPIGTVRSWLARGRALLRSRLEKNGIALSAAGLASLLAVAEASAAVSPTLAKATLAAASQLALGKSLASAGLSASVVTLVKAGQATATLLKSTMAGLICAILITAGVAGTMAAWPGQAPRGEDVANVLPKERSPIRPNEAGANPVDQNQPMVDDLKPKQDAGGPIRSLLGHKDRLTSVAYSADGKSIATAGWDGTIRLWDPKNGKEVRRLDVPPTQSYSPAYLSQILFSPDSEFVVVAQQSAPNEPGVIVWDRRTGGRVRDFPGVCVAIAPDGKHIACGGAGIRLYEFATGKLVREIHSPYFIYRLTFSRDGKTVFAQAEIPRPPLKNGLARLGFDPREVRAWDVATGKERQAGWKGAWAGNQIAISPDGRTLATDASLRETATGGHRTILTGHKDPVSGVAFSPDGRTLATASDDGTVRLWDLPSGKEIGRFGKERLIREGGWVLAVAFSPDGRSLVSGRLDKTAHIWDVSKITGRPRTSAERSPADLEVDWKDLGGDAAKGYAAIGRLTSSSKQAVPSLGKHLQAAKTPDTKRIEQLIGNLDDARFQVREQAAKELTELGEFAVPLVQKALAGNLALEVRRRLDALLERLEVASLSAETVRQIRAVEALESIGNAEALRLLEKLAVGPPEMRLTQEAMASARRLAKRSADGP